MDHAGTAPGRGWAGSGSRSVWQDQWTSHPSLTGHQRTVLGGRGKVGWVAVPSVCLAIDGHTDNPDRQRL
jgi:hypothetical protein